MSAKSPTNRTIALIGAHGMLAKMVRERAPEGFDLHLFDLPDFDLTNRAQVFEVLANIDPDVIINCAAYTNVDGAESEQNLAMMVNGTAVGFLAEAALNNDATLVHISTDYVFDGDNPAPYTETDSANPQSVYGQSKLLGEQSVESTNLTKYFILRTSWLYGPGGNNFVETILRLAAEREELRIIDDQVGSPTFTGDLADAIFNLLALTSPRSPVPSNGDSLHSGTLPYGIYHFANNGECSWYEFACAIVEEARVGGLPCMVNRIDPIRTDEYPLPAKRPGNSVFDKSRYKSITRAEIPNWRDSLRKYFSIREQSNQGVLNNARS
jgi:dTDP-4-dehydrorhamnose reductase